jgi:hypothetical protein
MYFKDKNIMYAHCPSTAGSTITELLRDYSVAVKHTEKIIIQAERVHKFGLPLYDATGMCIQWCQEHSPFDMMFETDNHVMESSFKITSIRNPYYRIASLYINQGMKPEMFGHYLLQMASYIQPFMIRLNDNVKNIHFWNEYKVTKMQTLWRNERFETRFSQNVNQRVWIPSVFWNYEFFMLSNFTHGKVQPDYIIRQENLQSDWNVLAKQFNMKTELPYKNKGKPKKLNELYNQETKELVDFIFKKDIEEHHYIF